MHDAESARAVVDGEFIELGFWSTSGSSIPPHSSRLTDPVILELVVPAGTPALRLGDLAEFPAEREVLVIDARSYFVVDVGFDYRRKMWRIRATVREVDS
ncbi:ADP-ribosyltransferase [Nocardia sp. NPDC058658]|uniref:ADP-ribosyltransferase n=1 Tax=Nocardia sp. NPDC058658 TaxID=3346580 RepID=UPI0036536E4F